MITSQIIVPEIKKFFGQNQTYLCITYDKFCTKSFCIIDRNGTLIRCLPVDSTRCSHTFKHDSYYFEFWGTRLEDRDERLRMIEQFSLQSEKGKQMARILNPIFFSLMI